MKILCKNCFYKWRSDGVDFCSKIEEDGSLFPANRTNCLIYIKKGTEPKLPCVVCKKNTFDSSSVSDAGKTYCEKCNWDIEEKRHNEERKKRIDNFIKLMRKEIETLYL